MPLLTTPQSVIQLGLRISKNSCCLRRQVGCVIWAPCGTEVRILSSSWNRPPRDNYCDSCKAGVPPRIGCSTTTHAEINAIRMLPNTSSPVSVFTTTSPCQACAERIFDKLGKRLVQWSYLEHYRDTEPVLWLSRNHVPIYQAEVIE
jgi:deoxycytidylate deaminase